MTRVNRQNISCIWMLITFMFGQSEYLPNGAFEWIENFNYLLDKHTISKDSPIGYVCEVDLDYPRNIHDLHNDLPLCSENRIIGDTKQIKLIADLSDKRNYIIHYRVLQQCMENGLILRKVHRILSFKQPSWLNEYIELNTSHRTNAKNSFEKNFFKLLSNAVYGKTMENVENRKDIK